MMRNKTNAESLAGMRARIEDYKKYICINIFDGDVLVFVRDKTEVC